MPMFSFTIAITRRRERRRRRQLQQQQQQQQARQRGNWLRLSSQKLKHFHPHHRQQQRQNGVQHQVQQIDYRMQQSNSATNLDSSYFKPRQTLQSRSTNSTPEFTPALRDSGECPIHETEHCSSLQQSLVVSHGYEPSSVALPQTAQDPSATALHSNAPIRNYASSQPQSEPDFESESSPKHPTNHFKRTASDTDLPRPSFDSLSSFSDRDSSSTFCSLASASSHIPTSCSLTSTAPSPRLPPSRNVTLRTDSGFHMAEPRRLPPSRHGRPRHSEQCAYDASSHHRSRQNQPVADPQEPTQGDSYNSIVLEQRFFSCLRIPFPLLSLGPSRPSARRHTSTSETRPRRHESHRSPHGSNFIRSVHSQFHNRKLHFPVHQHCIRSNASCYRSPTAPCDIRAPTNSSVEHQLNTPSISSSIVSSSLASCRSHSRQESTLTLSGQRETINIPNLLDLHDDVLLRIVHLVLDPVRVTTSDRIVESGFLAALPLASTCSRLRTLFFSSLRDLELWQSGKLSSDALVHVSNKVGPNLKRIVLRNCNRLEPAAILAVSLNCTAIRTIDLSNVSVLDDHLLSDMVRNCGATLRSLLVRDCFNLTDDSLRSVAKYTHNLDALDMSGLPAVTDDGMISLLASRGHGFVSLVCSSCPQLTDVSFQAMGLYCRNLEVLCARNLPMLTNSGIDAICKGVGDRIEVLDVLDCDSISVKRFLEIVASYCPRLSSRFMDGEGRTLRQVIISSLASFIFHVTGRDAFNGKSAVYFLLVDPGTSNCFRVSVGNEHMNLVDYGTILCSCFGERPNEQVRETLLSEFGLDLDADDQGL